MLGWLSGSLLLFCYFFVYGDESEKEGDFCLYNLPRYVTHHSNIVDVDLNRTSLVGVVSLMAQLSNLCRVH